VGSIMAIGDRRPYGALVTLDPEVTATFGGNVEAEVSAAVARANARLSRMKQIRRFAILPEPWLPASDEPTPTMKLRRRPIAEKYAAQINELYA
jgi:long-chain acyl-CoA synthetase